jgi:hypothetical protein
MRANVSNVYYLAAPMPEPTRPSRLSPRLRFRLRLLALWWRVRVTTTELVGVLRRFGRSESSVDPIILEQHAEIIRATPRRPVGPARIIDLAAARDRRRR